VSGKQDELRPIVLTVTIAPSKRGGRGIVVTGAPEGELPAVYTGAFSDLHRLIDQVWIEVNTRKPLVVTRKGKAVAESDASEDAATEAVVAPAPTQEQLDEARAEMVAEVADKMEADHVE